MKKSIFSGEISPKCIYCETGILSADRSTVLCTKKGVMQPDSCCKKFRYDPLKRTPESIKLRSDYSADDFSL